MLAECVLAECSGRAVLRLVLDSAASPTRLPLITRDAPGEGLGKEEQHPRVAEKQTDKYGDVRLLSLIIIFFHIKL